MHTLAITDIPRLSTLFEQIAAEHGDLLVVGEIHRGIEALDKLKPELIIIQNYLSGLSADILHKHLQSRLNRRSVRFALISPPHNLDPAFAARFERIIDPALPDEQLEQVIVSLLTPPARTSRATQHPVTSILDLPPVTEQEPELPGLQPDQPAAVDSVQISQPTPAKTQEPVATTPMAPPDDLLPEPQIYALPRRPNTSIISAFSQHLDTTAEELQPRPAAVADRDDDLAIRDLHREPHLAHEDEPPEPLHRRTAFWLVTVTVLLVVIITLFQQRPRSSQLADKAEPAAPRPPLTLERPAIPQPNSALPQGNGQGGRLQSHGQGRPKVLPSFIPQATFEQAYAKDNPGWERYHGQANEYRIFREKDSSIKAVQVIDRSGAGIQDGFYVSVLKELTGATAMRSTSSEIKEGYEIRRGTVAGLELVQYRDAQGGRLRGFVITWP